MPRDGSDVYNVPSGTYGIEDTTIESARYNAFVDDVAQDLNHPRPILSGGTAATNPVDAMTNLGGELTNQIITNYDGDPFQSGSFWSAATATGAPVAGHAFTGICYAHDLDNMFVEARDEVTTNIYLRQKKAGVWSGWLTATNASSIGVTPVGNISSTDLQSALAELDSEKVARAGDTMSGELQLFGNPVDPLGAVPKQYADQKLSMFGGQNISGGFTFTTYGNPPGSFTPDPIKGNYQSIANAGAFVISSMGFDCAIDLLVVNGPTAGVITFAGFTVGASGAGDPLTTTNGNVFIVSLRRMAGISTYVTKSLQ